MLPQSVQSGEVQRGAEARADDGGEGAAPELAQGVWSGGDVAEGVEKGGGAGLLDAGFQEVGGLEEGGGEDAGAEAGDEVECWFFLSVLGDSRARKGAGRGSLQDDALAGFSLDMSHLRGGCQRLSLMSITN